MSEQCDPYPLMASWSDARLRFEIDQALAASNDPKNSPEYRDSACWAAALMSKTLMDRNDKSNE